MLLPRAELAIVAEEKVRNYLLSFDHLQGRTKARFFSAHGFRPQEWQILARALREHACIPTAHLSKQSIYGSFYHVDGPLSAPDGSGPVIRSVWIVESDTSPPKLITAYPLHV